MYNKRRSYTNWNYIILKWSEEEGSGVIKALKFLNKINEVNSSCYVHQEKKKGI